MIQLTLIVGAVACFLLGTIALVRNGLNLLTTLAASIIYGLAIWLVAILVFIQSTSASMATVSAKIYYVTATILVALLAVFVNFINKRPPKQSAILAPVLLSLATIDGLILFLPGFIISGVVVETSGNYILADNFSYMIYSFYFISMLVLSGLTILKKLPTVGQKLRIQLLVLLVGCVLMATPGIIADILLPYSQSYHLVWLGIAMAVCIIGISAYFVTKKSLFDFRFAAVRTLAYVLSLAFLIVIYYSLATAISNVFSINRIVDQSTLGMILALVLLLIFQPIKNFFDKITSDIFYRDNYNTDELFGRINRILTSTTDLRLMLERTSLEIATTFKSEQAFFFVNTGEHHITAGSFHHSVLPKDDANALLRNDESKNKVVVASRLKPFSPLRRLMLSHRIELVVFLNRSGINGCLCMGDHLNSRYTKRDINVLETMADEMAIAIQNNISIQQVREVNEGLQQKIANATRELRGRNAVLSELDKAKDEFVSMASHQLRTPLTSVKGYISMVLEGDAGEVNSTQKKFLEEAYMSSERMVNLINDFLNVSRLQTGKFIIDRHEVDLAKIVEQEIDGLMPSAASRQLRLKYKKPKDFPMLNLDEGKIRQVIMNFTDNAIYYSHDNSVITVSLSIERNKAVFMVKDTGIGVPKEEQDRLFEKFFRATNARKHRPDGTGVGLFLAKKVIDSHGGELIFKSTEGKGSIFGFRLPLDR